MHRANLPDHISVGQLSIILHVAASSTSDRSGIYLSDYMRVAVSAERQLPGRSD